ncbi:MAG: hypothetical protein ACRCXX_11680 [Cetobacterium sp.]|uniref:hypothetical protein n=1 Tax=Cetobacterium sp. TaxID=2071632 RepID=UPI003F321B1F
MFKKKRVSSRELSKVCEELKVGLAEEREEILASIDTLEHQLAIAKDDLEINRKWLEKLSK